MADTPEAKVKKKIRAVLKANPDVWWTQPVPSGLGEPTLDFLCAVKFRGIAAFFAIEAKKPGGKASERQRIMMSAMEAVGGKTFLIDGDDGVLELEVWLNQIGMLTDGARS